MRVVYISPVPWNSYQHRPHFMVRALLAGQVDELLWIDAYPIRLPRPEDFARRGVQVRQDIPPTGGLEVFRPLALPIEPLPLGSWLNRTFFWRSVFQRVRSFAAAAFAGGGSWTLVVGRPCRLALDIFQKLRPPWSVFDAMDDFPEFYRGLSRAACRRTERAIAEQVDLVVASSTRLGEKFAWRAPHVLRASNGYPMALLPPYRPRSRTSGVLGYLGGIGSWFDWDLVLELARAAPEHTIELAGPCVTPPPTRRMPQNIRLSPAFRQADVYSHLLRFDAGLIPFKKNALTEGVDPIKFYEYRAGGLPVMSTSFGEMRFRGEKDGVLFLDGAEELRSVVRRSAELRVEEAAVAKFRRDNDWQVCLRPLLEWMGRRDPARRRDLAVSRRAA